MYCEYGILAIIVGGRCKAKTEESIISSGHASHKGSNVEGPSTGSRESQGTATRGHNPKPRQHAVSNHATGGTKRDGGRDGDLHKTQRGTITVVAAMSKEEAVVPPRAVTPPVQAKTWRPVCRCRARSRGARCCGSFGRRCCSGTVVPVGAPGDGGGDVRTGQVLPPLKQGGASDSISASMGDGRKPSWGSSMFVLQLTGKFKRGNLLRRREKQQLKPKPKAAIGMLNELAALSSRDHADELYVKELQCARQRRLSLMFCDARFERKYVNYHHDNWSLSALRERLLKFLGAFVFFAAFEDLLSSLRAPSLAQKLVAYAIVLAAFFGCYALNEALQWHEARSSTHDTNVIRLRLPLHAGFSVAWSFMLMGMAIQFEEIRYLSALLMPLLYGHSVLHFHWLGCVYMLVAVVFECVWVYVLDGWNSALDISTRAHSLHGVLIMSASLFMFVKYVCEQGSREHFRLVEVIELRKQQSIRGNALAQKLIANILPPFIVPQLNNHPCLAGHQMRAEPCPRSDASHVPYRPPEKDQVIAHSYSSISVLFATVLVEPVGDTTTSRSSNKTDATESAQLERVLLLDQVFSMFDRLLDLPTLPQRPAASKETYARHDLTSSPLIRRVRPVNTTTHATNSSMYEKIKTIGNTYMVAAGIPHECGSNTSVPALLKHAEAAVALSCKMQQAVASFNAAPDQSTAHDFSQVLLRVGIHSGTVTAGVIGIKKYCFDIWGDTVNVASRMDATGIPGRIHLSATTRQMLSGTAMFVDGTNSVEFEARGLVDVKGKGPMETFLVAETTRTGRHQANEPSLTSVGSSSTVVVASDSRASANTDTVGQRATSSGRLQVVLQPYSLAFETSAAETAFQQEYAKNNLRVANSSAVLVILFLLVLVCLTGCWFWLSFLARTSMDGRYHRAHDGSGSLVGDDDNDTEREMQLAWLIVVGNTLVAVIMVVQLHCSERAHNMQRRLGIFSVIGILVIFAMNVSADLIGYSQLLETPYILSGLIYVFFLSKLLVVRAATICWTWLLVHTVYRYSATGLHSLFYAQFGSPLFLCAMTMMLHVLASDNERKVRQGHWLRNMANAQRCVHSCLNSLYPLIIQLTD